MWIVVHMAMLKLDVFIRLVDFYTTQSGIDTQKLACDQMQTLWNNKTEFLVSRSVDVGQICDILC